MTLSTKAAEVIAQDKADRAAKVPRKTVTVTFDDTIRSFKRANVIRHMCLTDYTPAMIIELAYHGHVQKVGDTSSSHGGDPVAAHKAMDDADTALLNDQWRRISSTVASDPHGAIRTFINDILKDKFKAHGKKQPTVAECLAIFETLSETRQEKLVAEAEERKAKIIDDLEFDFAELESIKADVDAKAEADVEPALETETDLNQPTN